jgi:hypothetical protein
MAEARGPKGKAGKAIKASQAEIERLEREKPEGWEGRAQDIRRAIAAIEAVAGGNVDAAIDYLASESMLNSAIKKILADLVKDRRSGKIADEDDDNGDDDNGDDDKEDTEEDLDEKFDRAVAHYDINPAEMEARLSASDDFDTIPKTTASLLVYAQRQTKILALTGVEAALARFRLGRCLELVKSLDREGYNGFLRQLRISASTAQKAIRFREKCDTEDRVPKLGLTDAFEEMGITTRRGRPVDPLLEAQGLAEKLRAALKRAMAKETPDKMVVEKLRLTLQALGESIPTAVEAIAENLNVEAETRAKIRADREAKKQKPQTS